MLRAGVITGVHGVRGLVRVKSFLEDPLSLGDYGPVAAADGRSFELTVQTVKKGVAICQLKGVATRNQAEALKGTELFLNRDRLPDLGDSEEWYAVDLIGLAVFHVSGRSVGTVLAVQDYGAGDLLEIAVPDRKQSVLVPLTREIVPLIDLASRRVEIDPPPGMLEDQ